MQGRTGVLSGREKRVLLLAASFFISGALFFGMRMAGTLTASGGVEPSLPTVSSDVYLPADENPLSRMPPPESFERFTYTRESETYLVRAVCTDAYLAVLVFPRAIDYRTSPLDAKYNVAHTCTKGEQFALAIPLTDLPLLENEEYYVVTAAQGARGGWYNPQ